MEIFQFKQFQMIAECGTMREAAERLFLLQPTLSHNLKKLEAELDCKLFARSGNQLRLTPYGELVCQGTGAWHIDPGRCARGLCQGTGAWHIDPIIGRVAPSRARRR